tara:strand:+ start:1031 stop:1198 length:168 start_codon:yes stop_codon:yes gene_type:complete
MNYYHVAYFIDQKDVPTLSGLTIQAASISDAEFEFNQKMDFKVNSNQIKYIIKLN